MIRHTRCICFSLVQIMPIAGICLKVIILKIASGVWYGGDES